MAVPASPVPATPATVGSAEPGPRGASASPVAVVWCRQVDNEAESPGYTTVPEEFPGHRETLETIRIIGNLTVNVADTHDYWDPDPSQPLSYYPNLFLYPANGGRYTCVGRMFLSTEDRPRLGMKTVVLDTASLLASNEFGSTVLKWYASMGGGRPGGRLPPVPDPALFPVLGEGFLFQRGTTDPVVVIASEQWEPAVQAILEMVRTMPASLIAPAAILAFPYFLPAAKTDLKQFTEELPLALAIMRVARGEAAGERHAKRIAAWEAAATTRDLTDGLPNPGKGKEVVPLVLQYARDHDEAKLRPIAQRVDLVELPRLRQRIGDPERSAGKDRRKEMWRVGTAMESAALLLAKARGRHVPVTVDTAKRAQEYLQARLPIEPGVPPEPEPAGVGAQATGLPPTSTPQHPPWLQRNESTAPVRVDRVEVVPISHSDDPSLLAPSARPVDPANRVPAPESPGEAGPPASFRPGPSAAPVDIVALKAELERNVARWVEGRLAQIAQPPPPPSPTALGEEIDTRIARALAERTQAFPPNVAPSDLTQLEGRLLGELSVRLQANSEETLRAARSLIADARASAPAGPTPQELDALRSAWDSRLEALQRAQRQSLAEAVQGLAQRLDALARDAPAAGAAVAAGLSERITTLEQQARAPEVDARIAELLPAALTAEVARQIGPAIAARWTEMERHLDSAAKVSSDLTAQRLREEIARATERLRMEIAAAEEDLRQGLRAQVDLHLKEAGDQAFAARGQGEARLADTIARKFQEAEGKRDAAAAALEARLQALLDTRARELETRLPGTLLGPTSKLPGLIEARVTEAEGRLAAREDAHAGELREAQSAAAAELQVRMQAYFDQRLRESADRQRDTSVELLARMKSETEAALAKVGDSLPVQQAIRAQLAKVAEADRAERERSVEDRVRRAETQLRGDFLAALHRLEVLEQGLEARSKELRDVELSVRSDIAELDRRTAILSDRLVPVIRKTWMRIGELEKTGGGSPDSDAALGQLRRELQRDLRRLESDIAARETALRDRMETAIANQGRVWLTLIRQLSNLAGERKEVPLPAIEVPEEGPGSVEPAPTDDPGELDDLPELLKSRRRPSAAPAVTPPEEDPSGGPGRRRKTPSRG